MPIDPARATELRAAVAHERDRIVAVARHVHDHPELAYEEVEAAARLRAELATALAVAPAPDGFPTAFRAELTGARPGRTVALVAVYDAVGVPDGRGGLRGEHSCGHGPVAAGVVGAALALAARRDTLAGRVVVLGTPADELVSPLAVTRGSGKAATLAAGLWEGVDAALYAHPESRTGVWRASRWMRLVELTVPAAADPGAWDLPPDRYRIDAADEPAGGTRRVVLRVLGDDAAQLAARAERARDRLAPLAWTPLGLTEGLAADPAVAATVESALAVLGVDHDPAPPTMPFSTDFGNVARRLPAAMVGIARPEGWAVHTAEGEAQFRSPAGDDLAVRVAEVLAVAADALTREAA